jgi:thioredoxin-dependent peroxiredoxin
VTIKAGEPAPDFTLPGTGGREYSLSAERGHAVVLAFYPGDETPVCTTQLTSYSTDLEQFTDLWATLWGISPQDVESHEAFAANRGFRFPLLADVDKSVGEAYGILGPLGFYRRSVFVVDPSGIVRFAHRSLVGATFKRTDELVAAVQAAVGATG